MLSDQRNAALRFPSIESPQTDKNADNVIEDENKV